MNDFMQLTTRKMTRKFTEIKQELSNAELNEDGSLKSITSPNHVNSQLTAIKREECSVTSQVGEDSVHLNKMTASLTCQVKTEPESEDEEDCCGLESMAGDYPDGFVIKREIIEVHTEDQHMMDVEVNHRKTIKDEGSGTEANRIVVKCEYDISSPNFPDSNIDEQKKVFDLTRKRNKQQMCERIGEETEMSHTPAETLCETKENRACSVCGKTFHSRQACLQHMWNKHTAENPNYCEVCRKGFKNLSQLQKHKAVHSDLRPYSCDVCKRTYTQKKYLDSHIATVHSDERPYSCDVCNKAFKSKSDLELHIDSRHSDERPYSCDVCKKAFKRKKHLYLHKATVHSDERPHSCDVCDKAFTQKVHLQKHKMTVHSDLRPYSCDVCNKAFKQKGTLKYHKVSCHLDKRPCS